MTSPPRQKSKSARRAPWKYVLMYGTTLVGVGLVTAALQAAHLPQLVANYSMFYLLVVIGSAVTFGRGPAVAAAIFSYLAIDYYFIGPGSFFSWGDRQQILAFIIFLIVAFTTGQLTGLLRAREEEARNREREAEALADASWTVASQVDRSRALAQVMHRLTEVLGLKAAAILAPADGDAGRALRVVASSGRARKLHENFDEIEARARQLLSNSAAAGPSGLRLEQTRAAQRSPEETDLIPLVIEQRALGVLYLRPQSDQVLSSEEWRLVASLANHAAVVLERDRLMEGQARTQALAEADRLKTALLGMVSHDFRSPLASIKAGVTGLLQEGAPWVPEMSRDLLQAINLETDRLIAMVGNILALSRLEGGAWRPQCEATDIAELIGAALDSFSEAENRRIQLDFHPSATEVNLDAVQIIQVIHNLLENALKYSDENQTVELRVAEERDSLMIDVLDRGRGLPAGDEHRIFDRFYRAPGLGESSVAGLGLGLTVCYGLIEANGGQLTASNRPGGGAQFRIEIPMGAR